MESLNYELTYCVYSVHTHTHTHKYILFIITHTFPGFMLGPFIVLCFYSMCSFLIIYPFVFYFCKKSFLLVKSYLILISSILVVTCEVHS